MTTFVLDTLDYASKLKAGGFSEQQAETQARALAEILDRQIATKSEGAEHEDNLRRDIEQLRAELKRDIRDMELKLETRIAETNARIAEAKADLTRWVVGAGVLQTSLVIGVLLKVAKLL
jgi:hypothetical protein